MAYLKQYKNDVFISFAHADNTPIAPGEVGWVERLHKELSAALRMRLGAAPKIFYSERDAQGGEFVLDDFLQVVRDSALMLSVASRNYVRDSSGEKPWTLKELDEFIARRGEEQLFLAQILPYHNDDPGHDVLRRKIPVKFWYETSHGHPAPLHPTTTDKTDAYRDLVGDLAEVLSDKLRDLARGEEVDISQSTGTVLLAQVTDDLENARDGVRRHLKQFGIRVIPEAGVDYPADRAGFEVAYSRDLEDADLVVQLLSDKIGRRPEGFVRLQAELTARADKSLMQWRSALLPVEELSPEHRQFLEGPTVLVEPAESFCSTIVSTLRALQEPKPVDRAPRAQALVYIAAHECDMVIARGFGDMLTQRGYIPSLPLVRGSTGALREDLEGNIIDSDAFILIYGRSSNVWVRSQLRRYNMIKGRRETPLLKFWLCKAPPEPKEPIDMHVPELTEINVSELPEVVGNLRPGGQ